MFLVEFRSVPLELQRKNEQEDFSLTWELSYNICQFSQNPFPFDIVLSHSVYGTFAGGSPRSFSGFCDYNSYLYSAYTTRASFTMDNSSFTFYLANIVTSDSGYYTLTLSCQFCYSYQENTSTLFVYGW